MTDSEHGNYDITSQHDAYHAIAALGVSPIARCPGMGSEKWDIRVALDAGAHGVMIPLVDSKVRLQRCAKADSRNKRKTLSIAPSTHPSVGVLPEGAFSCKPSTSTTAAPSPNKSTLQQPTTLLSS